MNLHKRTQVVAFFLMFFIVLGLAFQVVRPFLGILIVSSILSILSRPLFRKILKKSKTRSLAALVTVFVIILIILVPLWLFGQILFNELVGAFNSVRSGSLVINQQEIINSLPDQVRNFIQTVSIDANNIATRLTSNAFQTFSQLVSNIATFVLSFFLVIFTTFYLLKDGHHMKQVFMDLSPINNNQESVLFEKIALSVNGVVKGIFIVALIQGAVATVGFYIVGLPNSFLWGLLTIFAALVPTIGTSLVIVPAIIYLLITGHGGAALVLVIWGSIAVGLVDNFVGPKLIGKTAQVHPLLILISVIGGVSVFGFLGFLLGPILMAVLVAMVDMYRTDFQEYLEDKK